jgi:hypothetical protein
VKILLAVLAALVVLLGVHMALELAAAATVVAAFAVGGRAMENGWRIVPARRFA